MSRLNVSHVVSKRKLTKFLVDTGKVRGWDDPRMPTISGLRRQGYSPAAVNAFCRDVGVTRNENFIEYSRLNTSARGKISRRTRGRRMAVREPLKVTLVGDASLFRTYDAPNHPTDQTVYATADTGLRQYTSKPGTSTASRLQDTVWR